MIRVVGRYDILPGVNGAGSKTPQAVGRSPTTTRFPQPHARGRTGRHAEKVGVSFRASDGGKIPPRGRTPVRARYVSPMRGVAGSASRQGRGISLHSARPRRVVGLAPAVRGQGRTGRAIGLPVLWATVDRLARRRGWIGRAVTRSRTRALTARFQRRYGYCEDIGVHTPRLSPFSVVTPSSRGWCLSMSAGRTQGVPGLISALELPQYSTLTGLNSAVGQPSERDSRPP